LKIQPKKDKIEISTFKSDTAEQYGIYSVS